MDYKQVISNLTIYGGTHALVDATCGAGLFTILTLGYSNLADFFYLVVLYNVLAFGLQCPLGFAVDKLRIPKIAAATGCLLTAISTLALELPLIAVVVMGIGNALFHVGGGIISLNLIPKKASAPGIYVAPGAFGLFIGIMIGRGGYFVAWPFIILSLLAFASMLLLDKPKIDYKTDLRGDFKYLELIILLLLFSITIRSLIGMVLVFPWKTDLDLLTILTLAVVAGKALGGILADRFGWVRVATSGLLFSAPLLSFFSANPLLGILGVFLFNMTMPVTLVAIANLLPGRAGFAFGLTTLALLTGALPAFTGLKTAMAEELFILGIILMSAAVLYYSLKTYFNKFDI